MEIIILLIKIFSVLFFVGYGFTAIFIPEKLRPNAFWLAPWFGIILTAVIGVILSLLRIPLIQAKYIIIAIAATFFLWSVFNKKRLLYLTKETLLISLLTVTCLIFNLFPLLTRAGFPTTISLGNLDPIAYVHTGDFLINHTVYEGGKYIQYKPGSAATVDLIGYWSRWGSPMVLGFVSSIFNLRSYQTYSILITLFFVLSFPVVYILSKQFIEKERSYLLLFLIFLTYGFNSTILYMLYNVFFAQFAFLGIFITSLILLHSYFSDKKKLIGFNNYDLLISLCLSALTAIYLEGLLFIIAPLLLFVTAKLLQKNFTYIIYLAKIIVLTFIFNPISFGNALRSNYAIFISTTKTATIGWEKIRYALPYEMIGIYNLYYSRNLPVFIAIILSLIIIGIMLVGLFKIKQKLFTVSFMVFFAFLYLMFAFVFKNYFTYHRAVTYTLFIIPILFSCGVLTIISFWKSKILVITIMTVISLLSFRSSYRTIYQLYWHPRIVDQSLISLSELNNNKNFDTPFYTSDIFLGEYNLWKRLWQEYFLKDKRIVSRQNYPVEIESMKGTLLVLSENNYLEKDGKKIIYKNIVWQNQYYLLGEIRPLEVAEDLKIY